MTYCSFFFCIQDIFYWSVELLKWYLFMKILVILWTRQLGFICLTCKTTRERWQINFMEGISFQKKSHFLNILSSLFLFSIFFYFQFFFFWKPFALQCRLKIFNFNGGCHLTFFYSNLHQLRFARKCRNKGSHHFHTRTM